MLSDLAKRVMANPLYEFDTDYSLDNGAMPLINVKDPEMFTIAFGCKPDFTLNEWMERFPDISAYHVVYGKRRKNGKPTAMFYKQLSSKNSKMVVFSLRILDGEPTTVCWPSDEEYQDQVNAFARDMEALCKEGDYKTFFRMRDPIGDGSALWDSFIAAIQYNAFTNVELYAALIEGIRVYPAWRYKFEQMKKHDAGMFFSVGEAMTSGTSALADERAGRLFGLSRIPEPIELYASNEHSYLWYKDKFSALKEAAMLDDVIGVDRSLNIVSVRGNDILDIVTLKDESKLYLVEDPPIRDMQYVIPLLNAENYLWEDDKRQPELPKHAYIIPTVRRTDRIYEGLPPFVKGPNDLDELDASRVRALRVSLLAALIYKQNTQDIPLKLKKLPLAERAVFYSLVQVTYYTAGHIHDFEEEERMLQRFGTRVLEEGRWKSIMWTSKGIGADDFEEHGDDFIGYICMALTKSLLADDEMDLLCKIDSTSGKPSDYGMLATFTCYKMNMSKQAFCVYEKLLSWAVLSLRDALYLDRWRFGENAVSMPETDGGVKSMALAYALQDKKYLLELLKSLPEEAR